ncbi:MAG: ArgE/DapE family deacylase [Chloroflexota bacterium]|nr:ArgE/DapE family deacylase [Chloroflexota bacterium]
MPETPGTTATVDRARLVADLQALVRIPSVTGSEEAVAAWVGDALREVGLATDIVRPDPAEIRADPAWPGAEMPRTSLPVVVGRAGTPGGARLILSGHLDVVPPGEPTTWTVDPWGGEIRGERLYGRGAVDMKGGVAAILGAVRALGSSPGLDALTGELLVVLVPSEEDGGQGTLAAIRELETADMAIITEPSQLDLVVAHAGAITFRLTVPGRAAHASHRREGVSALDKLFVLVRALEADEARRNESETDPLMRALGLPYATIIGKVTGGEWASTVLDRIVAEGRYGVRLGQSPEEAADELRACIAASCAADPFLREHPATVEITGGQFGSARVPVDHGLVTSLTDAARAVTGRVPRLLGEPYGADMQMFVNVGGIPCVIFGPGDVRVAHSADEWVPLDEVEACAAVLATWVSRQIGPR